MSKPKCVDGSVHPKGTDTINCTLCRADSVARMKAFKATLPEPEYDWEDLEFQDRRSREDPEWYKSTRRG